MSYCNERAFQCEFDQTKCSSGDFKTFGHAKYGLCHTFNHGFNQSALKTSHIGAEYGFKLLLYINQVCHRNFMSPKLYVSKTLRHQNFASPTSMLFQDEYIGLTTPSAGVRVSIHEPGTTSFPEEQGQDHRSGPNPLILGRLVRRFLIKDLMPELEHQQLLRLEPMKFNEQNFHITTKTVAKWLTIKKLMINYGIIMECKYRTRSYYLGSFLIIAFEMYSLI